MPENNNSPKLLFAFSKSYSAQTELEDTSEVVGVMLWPFKR